MFSGSVHLSPNFSTSPDGRRGTSGATTCWMNQGCCDGQLHDRASCRPERRRRPCRPARRSSSRRSCTPRRPRCRTAGRRSPPRARARESASTSRRSPARSQGRRSSTSVARRWKVTVLPSSLTSQLSASDGSASSVSGFSLTSGSMMARRTFDDVVSVARPGSSDGGSAPQAIGKPVRGGRPCPCRRPCRPAAARLVASAASRGPSVKTRPRAQTSKQFLSPHCCPPLCSRTAARHWPGGQLDA